MRRTGSYDRDCGRLGMVVGLVMGFRGKRRRAEGGDMVETAAGKRSERDEGIGLLCGVVGVLRG